MIKEILTSLFILAIFSILLTVTIPPAILEPVGWMLNTDITFHKYGDAGIGNQSASYFDFYILLEDGYFLELPVLHLILLSLLLLFPAFLLLLTLASLHLKTRNKMNKTRQGYFSNFIEVLDIGKIKPSFWLLFCPLVLAIYLINTSYHQKLIAAATTTWKHLTEENIYKPAHLTFNNDKRIYWNSYIREIYPRRYYKHNGTFRSNSRYQFSLIATTPDGESIFNLHRNSSSNVQIKVRENYILIWDQFDLNIVNTHTFAELPLNLTELARKIKKDFNSIDSITYSEDSNLVSLIDDKANAVKISLNSLLSVETNNYPIVKTTRVLGKDHRAKKLYLPNEHSVSSEILLRPKVLEQDQFGLIVSTYNSVSDSHASNIEVFDSDLKRQWKAPIAQYKAYMAPFKNKECKDLSVLMNKEIISVTYSFLNINCKTDFFHRMTGKLAAQSTMGTLELYTSGR